jgi:subfamily B ATP-binding cassette protein MsbA
MMTKLNAELPLFAQQSAISSPTPLVYEADHSTLVERLHCSPAGLHRAGAAGHFAVPELEAHADRAGCCFRLLVLACVLSRRFLQAHQQPARFTDELAHVVEENALAHRIVRLSVAPRPAKPSAL